jgi:iron complex transport system permease protein
LNRRCAPIDADEIKSVEAYRVFDRCSSAFICGSLPFPMMRLSPLLIVLPAAAAASLVVAVLVGTFPIPVTQVLDSIFFPVPGVVHDVVWKLRMPRALAAFVCGALLASSGVLLQVLLRNPLADPYILGVSGGAALGVLAALAAGAGTALTHGAAFAGAAVAIAIVFGLSFRAGDWNLHRLLLTGVVLSAGFGALISLLLTLAPQAQVKGMLFWLIGDLSHAGDSSAAWLLLGLLFAGFMPLAGSLDALILGPLKARTLGVPVTALQAALYFCAALATVAAVVLGGTIGFVGLMVPHALRLSGVSDHRRLLPAAALAGGCLLVVGDTIARVAWAPQELPVGVFTALLGVPVLLTLLSRRT